MTHNELKKGDRVRLTDAGFGIRHATMTDNRRGILRQVRIEERDGYFPDVGDNYVDDIIAVERNGEWQPVELAPAHARRMKGIRAAGW